MTSRWLAAALGLALCVHAPRAMSQAPASKPILKDEVYSGPIPRSSVSLRVGMFGGASNQEMIEYLDVGVQQPFQVSYEDFPTGLALDIGYVYKPHPRFGLRLNGSASFFRYTSEGDFVPQVPADSLLTQLVYDRELAVQLFVLEASGIYYFTDASTTDLQTYLGAGFSLGIPHEDYSETWTDVDTGLPYTEPIPGRVSEASEWDVTGGVHAVFGLLYWFSDQWGLTAEARGQFMEGRFEQLEAVDPDTGEYENINFVIDYSGFFLSIGLSYGF
jgi:hypothetical protein